MHRHVINSVQEFHGALRATPHPPDRASHPCMEERLARQQSRSVKRLLDCRPGLKQQAYFSDQVLYGRRQVIHGDSCLAACESSTAAPGVFQNRLYRTINHLTGALISDEFILDTGLRRSCVESFETYPSNGAAWPPEQAEPDPVFVIAAGEGMRGQGSRRGGQQRSADTRPVLERRRTRENYPRRQCRWEQTDLAELFRCMDSRLGLKPAGERAISKLIEKQTYVIQY